MDRRATTWRMLLTLLLLLSPLGGLGHVAAQVGGPTGATAASGTVVGWGSNFDGRATAPAGLAGVTAIAAGIDHSLALVASAPAGPISIIGPRVQHQRVSNNEWIDVPATGTYDGNDITITATLHNNSAVSQTGRVSFYADGVLLSSLDRTLAPGDSPDVSYTWETEGWAWNEDGSGHPTSRALTVTVDVGQNSSTTTPYALKVRPKPVFLVHGYHGNADRDTGTWSRYVGAGFLRAAHLDWEGIPVPGMNMDSSPQAHTIVDNAAILAEVIQAHRVRLDARHVDIVAHSLGGLVSRQYIETSMPGSGDSAPVVSHLVMLGTPNLGSDCTKLRAVFYPIAGLFTGGTFGWPDLELLTPYVETVFNPRVKSKKGVEFDNFVGYGLPGCDTDLRLGDTAVRSSSASAFADRLFDRALRLHTSMPASPEDFFDFVKPCLAVSRAGRAAACGNAAVSPAATAQAEPTPQVIHAEGTSLGAGGVATIPLALSGGSRLGVMVEAPASVDAELLDPSGASVDHDAAGGERAQGAFRVLSAASPASGTWQLRLHNTDGAAHDVAVSAWVFDAPLALAVGAGTPTVDGRVQIDATLTNNGAPVTGASARACVSGTAGTSIDLPLQEVGNGTYRATAGPLAVGQYVIAVVTSSGGEQRGATTTVAIAASGPAPSPSPLPSPKTFADVPADYWANAQIGQFAARGITTGCGDDGQGRRLYCPERGVTRAEMATFITRTLGQDKAVPPTTPTFADVPTDYWAYTQIEAFARLGITTGCGLDELGRRIFCPDRGVTRAEMAAFLDRAKVQGELAPGAPTFADVPTGYWAYGWIERFFTLGVTTGCGTDDQGRKVYCPDRGVTRAEMAVFIIRAYP